MYFLTPLVKKENEDTYDYRSYGEKMSTKLWNQFAYRMISNAKEDCGLYCEEERFCDFFVPLSDTCYLGTFRRKVHLMKVKTGTYGNDVFPVFKSTSESVW